MDPSSAGQNPTNPWTAFDRIYCITLHDRPDRRAHAQAEFQRVGLADIVEFTVAERHPTDSEQGIFESHMRCLRAGLAADARTIVVFEDDVIFPHFAPHILNDAVAFMQSGTPWDLFFFGCFVNASRKTPHRSVIKIRYKTTAHAYVINRDFALALVEHSWQGVAYDDLIRSLATDRVFASYPAIAFQSDASTDNQKMLVADKIRRLLGGMRRLQKLNEFTHRHFIALIVIHAAIILLVILLLVLRPPETRTAPDSRPTSPPATLQTRLSPAPPEPARPADAPLAPRWPGGEGPQTST
jgi:GR25 family glycosyltransferase involved in LPS biosynthesis